MHWGINPPLKNNTPLFLTKPPFNQQNWFFVNLPLKAGSFSEPQKY